MCASTRDSVSVEPRAADHQVADVAHQVVEPRQIDAHEVRRAADPCRSTSHRARRDSGRLDAGAGASSAIRSTSMPSARHAPIVASSSAPASTKSNAIAPSAVTRGTASRISPAAAQPRANRVDADAARDQLGRRRERAAPPRRDGDGEPAAGIVGRALAPGRGRRRRAARCAPRRDRSAGNVPPVRRTLHHLLEHLRAVEQRVDALGAEHRVALTQRAQIVLETMRQVLGLAQLHHPGDALQRVEVPEQLVEHGRLMSARPTDASSASSSRRTPVRCSSHSAK